jgi:hypothetical protein
MKEDLTICRAALQRVSEENKKHLEQNLNSVSLFAADLIVSKVANILLSLESERERCRCGSD